MLHNLCMPALIYLIYATTRIILDVYKGLYNSAFVQVWIAMLFTYLLNIMCRAGLGIVSWLIVSIPFILMSTIAGVLLFVFGLNPATGKAMYTPQVQFATTITSAQGGHSPATMTNEVQPAYGTVTDTSGTGTSGSGTSGSGTSGTGTSGTGTTAPAPPAVPPPPVTTPEPSASNAPSPTSSVPEMVSQTSCTPPPPPPPVSNAQYANPITVNVESFRGILGSGPRPNFY
jgi:hypothetical protein